MSSERMKKINLKFLKKALRLELINNGVVLKRLKRPCTMRLSSIISTCNNFKPVGVLAGS